MKSAPTNVSECGEKKGREENAELTGLEPATPAVTGQCSNQLSYSSKILFLNSESRVCGISCPMEKKGYSDVMAGAQVFYECQRCGNCCRWPGRVKIYPPDLDRLAAFLKEDPLEVTEKYMNLDPGRKFLILKNRPNGECIFLSGKNHCMIQEAKPEQCVGFPNAWRFPGWREMCEALPVEKGEKKVL